MGSYVVAVRGRARKTHRTKGKLAVPRSRFKPGWPFGVPDSPSPGDDWVVGPARTRTAPQGRSENGGSLGRTSSIASRDQRRPRDPRRDHGLPTVYEHDHVTGLEVRRGVLKKSEVVA